MKYTPPKLYSDTTFDTAIRIFHISNQITHATLCTTYRISRTSYPVPHDSCLKPHIPYSISESAMLAKIAKSQQAGLFLQIPGTSIVQYIQIFETRDSVISDRFLVPEIEIANPPDAI